MKIQLFISVLLLAVRAVDLQVQQFSYTADLKEKGIFKSKLRLGSMLKN